jgi:hypothetical protein
MENKIKLLSCECSHQIIIFLERNHLLEGPQAWPDSNQLWFLCPHEITIKSIDVFLDGPFLRDHPLIRREGMNGTFSFPPICESMKKLGVSIPLKDPLLSPALSSRAVSSIPPQNSTSPSFGPLGGISEPTHLHQGPNHLPQNPTLGS